MDRRIYNCVVCDIVMHSEQLRLDEGHVGTAWNQWPLNIEGLTKVHIAIPQDAVEIIKQLLGG